MEEEFLQMDEVKQALEEYFKTKDYDELYDTLNTQYEDKYGENLSEEVLEEYLESQEVGEEDEELAKKIKLFEQSLTRTLRESISFNEEVLSSATFDVSNIRVKVKKEQIEEAMLNARRLKESPQFEEIKETEEFKIIENNLKDIESVVLGTRQRKTAVDLPFDDFFGGLSSTTKELMETYEYWSNVKEKEKTYLSTIRDGIDKMQELLEKLGLTKLPEYAKVIEDVDKETEEVKLEPLSYLHNFENVKFQLKDIDDRMDDLIDEFIREYGRDISLADSREIEEAGNEYFDPLTARFILKNKKVVVKESEIEEVKEEIKQELESTDFSEDMQVLIDEYVESLEIIESVDGSDFILPIFIAEQLGKFAPTSIINKEMNKSKEAGERINRFLEAFADLVEGTKTTLPVYEEISKPMYIQGGRSERTVREDDSRRASTFRIRSGSAGTKRDVNEFEDTLFDVMNAINQYFIKPLDSKHSRGIKFPYENKLLRIEQYMGKTDFLTELSLEEGDGTGAKREFEAGFTQNLQRRIIRSKGRLLTSKNFETINEFFNLLKTRRTSIKELIEISEKLYKLIIKKIGRADKNKIKDNIASLLGSIAEKRGEGGANKFMGVRIDKAFEELNVDDPKEMFYIKRFFDQIYRNKSAFSRANQKGEVDRFVDNYETIAKSDFNEKLLEVHDSLRLLKSEEVIVGFRDLGNHNDIIKTVIDMEEDGLDISALDVESIVKSDDAYGNISREFGISFNKVYEIKAMFR